MVDQVDLLHGFRQTTTQPIEQDVTDTIESGVKSRTGTQYVVTETFEELSVGDKVLSTEIISAVRSRNVEFYAANLKPSTRIYAFFDGKDVTKFCVPKLIEISMSSGTFQVGETVQGRVIDKGLGEEGKDTNPSINFRVAQSNHRRGDYDSPTEVYPDNPYVNGGIIPEVLFFYINHIECRYIFSRRSTTRRFLWVYSDRNETDWTNKWSRSRSNKC